MITVAKELKNKNPESEAKIYHFYGYNNQIFSRSFLEDSKHDGPINVLINMGFVPAGDFTWIKKK